MSRRARRFALGVLAGGAVLGAGADAFAQRPPGGPPTGPTQSRPTQNKNVGPRKGQPQDDDDQGGPPPPGAVRAEPEIQLPSDPLAIPKEMEGKLGSDDDQRPPAPVGEVDRRFRGYYEETRGDYRMRLLPPLYLQHTRSLGRVQDTPSGQVSAEDRESLYGLLYYQRRSPQKDADVLFPLAWRLRDGDSHIYAFGPAAHREAPHEHDNWLAPLFFEGKRKDGGYFHAPLLLTSTHWGEKGAFTIAGPYFRDRTGSEVNWGVAPFFFHGDNGNDDGARKTWTLIPPLLYYHRETEIDDEKLTVVGPVLSKSNPKRDVFDVLPFFYSIRGKPETGGVRESHTTLFPFFHYGTSDEQTLLVLPGVVSRKTRTSSTLLTPFYSNAQTRSGATDLTAIGPGVPLFWRYRDTDLGARGLGIFPFYYGSDSPTGRTLLTPLFGRFESYGVSRTYWFFPTLQVTQSTTGWETNLWPVAFLGRDKDKSHTVLAPLFWDFANPKGRTTIGFPVFWRFADKTDDSIVQVAGNTLYLQKRVSNGTDWSFHFLPLFSYGENPTGYFWNVLFGLAGYERAGSYGRVKAFWLPITVDSPRETKEAAR